MTASIYHQTLVTVSSALDIQAIRLSGHLWTIGLMDQLTRVRVRVSSPSVSLTVRCIVKCDPSDTSYRVQRGTSGSKQQTVSVNSTAITDNQCHV